MLLAELQFSDSNLHQIVCRLRLRRTTLHWGSLQRSPDPLQAVFIGPTSAGEGDARGEEGGESEAGSFL